MVKGKKIQDVKVSEAKAEIKLETTSIKKVDEVPKLEKKTELLTKSVEQQEKTVSKKPKKEGKVETPKEVKVEASKEVKVEESKEVKVEASKEVKVEGKKVVKGEKKVKVVKEEVKIEAKEENKLEDISTLQEGGELDAAVKDRYFRCVYENDAFGRYSGKKPKQAAVKALTTIIKKSGGNAECVNKLFRFKMVECTRGGKKKESVYEGKREKLENPIPVIIKSVKGEKIEKREIIYRFSNKLKKIKDVKVGGEKKVKKITKVKGKKAVKVVGDKLLNKE